MDYTTEIHFASMPLLRVIELPFELPVKRYHIAVSGGRLQYLVLHSDSEHQPNRRAFHTDSAYTFDYCGELNSPVHVAADPLRLHSAQAADACPASGREYRDRRDDAVGHKECIDS